MTVEQAISLGMLIIALLTVLSTMRKNKQDNQGAIVTHFKTLVDAYLAEIQRLNTEQEQREKEHREELLELQQEMASVIAQNKQELAESNAQHTEEIARIKAEHTQEIAGLKRSISELKELTIQQAADLQAIDRRRRGNRDGI